MTHGPLALFIAALLVTPASAQTPAPVTGTFSSKGVAFKAAGGVAFRGPSSLSGETVLIVALSNTGLNAEAIADFVDRKRAIEKLIKDDETPIVYLEFTPQGTWRGLSYYLASGNGCMFCSSDVASTVKLANGRLTGKVKGSEQDRPFDLALDVPILSDDHGAPLPADGGEPGKAYLAYHATLAKQNAAALEPLLSPGNREVFARAKKSGKLDGYVSYLVDKHQMSTVRVVKGWVTPTKASLIIAGESSIGRIAGEVLLVKANGAWGVDEELVDLSLGQ